MINKYVKIWLPLTILVFIGLIYALIRSLNAAPKAFDGQRAYNDVKYQMDLGPRTMGSASHEAAAQWIIDTMQKAGWRVETQETVIAGQNIKNIIAKRGSGTPWVIIGSHYDSRSQADRDTNVTNRYQPVPGANDGASTVGILLELGRVIPDPMNKQVWLVFFDDEDNGNNSGAGWSIGAEYFVSQLTGKPDAVVILDMLGDKDLKIYMEQKSDKDLNNEIWGTAKALGYDQFVPMYKYSIIDDHLPFIKAGIRAVDVIDINYPYWHTTQDTLDKISADSLKAVGKTILSWLEQYPK